MGRTECQTRILIASGLWLASKGKSNSSSNSSNESEMALFFECMLLCAQKVLDTADIVREAIFANRSDIITVWHCRDDQNY